MKLFSSRKLVGCILTSLVLIGLALSQTGCGGGGGDDPRNMGLSGKVTFKGEPVPFGRIVFEPDSSAGNSGPQGFADIRNGTYDTADNGKGSVGGPHIVRITGSAADPATGNEDNPVPSLFPNYETKVDLPKGAATQDFDVPDGQDAGAPAQPKP